MPVLFVPVSPSGSSSINAVVRMMPKPACMSHAPIRRSRHEYSTREQVVTVPSVHFLFQIESAPVPQILRVAHMGETMMIFHSKPTAVILPFFDHFCLPETQLHRQVAYISPLSLPPHQSMSSSNITTAPPSDSSPPISFLTAPKSLVSP